MLSNRANRVALWGARPAKLLSFPSGCSRFGRCQSFLEAPNVSAGPIDRDLKTFGDLLGAFSAASLVLVCFKTRFSRLGISVCRF